MMRENIITNTAKNAIKLKIVDNTSSKIGQRE